jgi:tetratricopeptide (TPR) repeat protein
VLAFAFFGLDVTNLRSSAIGPETMLGRKATSFNPHNIYEDDKPHTLEVSKTTQSYPVQVQPSCWQTDCHKANNYHAKLDCSNEVATKWNLLGVQAMERYLQGDRITSTDEDFMNIYLNNAIDYFIKAVASDATCPRAHINLALCYLEKEQIQSALHHAGIAIKEGPNEARYWAIRSFIHEVAGKETERKSDLEMALTIDPYIGERKYFGILLCNVTDMTKYVRIPLIGIVSVAAERVLARKFLLWVEFAPVSVADYALLEPGTTDGFIENKYTVIRNMIPPILLREAQKCYRAGLQSGRITLTYAQAPRYVTQNDRCGRIILFQLVDFVRRIIAHNARPSYCYFGGYFNGSYLNPHSDRPQCEFTISFTVEQNPIDNAWPLGVYRVPQFEKNDEWPGRDKEPWPEEKDQIWVELLAGDGLLFMGRHMIHFRKGLLLGEDRWLNQIFFHYVQEGFTGTLD